MQPRQRLLSWFIPRFSIQQLSLLVVVCGVLFAAFSVWYQRVEKQRAIVEQLTELGASVTYDQRYMDRYGPNVIGGLTPTTWRDRVDDWLVTKFGTDAVYDVRRIYAFNENAGEAIKLIPRLQSLSELQVVLNEEQFDEAWQSLVLCKQLKRLDLKRPRTKHLSGMSQLKALEHLKIDYGELNRDDLKEIGKLDKLRLLDLSLVWTRDDALKPLENLTSLQEFHLKHAGSSETVSNRGITFLKCMPDLKKLTLARMPYVDDDALDLIGNLKQLQYLNLDQAGLNGSKLSKLAGLKDLTELNLIGTNTNNQAMDHIAKLHNLKFLDLGFTKVTDVGLQRLTDLPQLEVLHLSGLKLSDKAMQAVSDLKQLRELFLVRVPITDDGIEPLLQMNSLQTIGLDQTGVTKKGQSRIKQMLPNCRIW